MPRKITSAVDRNRLKSAAQSLELPEGMGLIIRTAGENRTKAEIKRKRWFEALCLRA
ncbi:MAG TPA: ribonuclease E/G [Rhizomicrobium sp.]|nr:ribonuclease E/G [Rhizomicrobium sp.]